MPHVREQIRDAVVTACTGLTTTGTRVYRERLYQLRAADLPGLRIYCGAEQVEPDRLGAIHGQQRDMDLMVEGLARATSDLDETLDDICAEVEAALATDITLGGKAKVLYLAGIDDPEQSDDGDVPAGLVRLKFRVQYRTLNTTPTATA
jgi:hypothetical protein